MINKVCYVLSARQNASKICFSITSLKVFQHFFVEKRCRPKQNENIKAGEASISIRIKYSYENNIHINNFSQALHNFTIFNFIPKLDNNYYDVLL